MKIVFYAHDSLLYGASRSLLSLIESLRSYDIEILVILPYQGTLTSYFQKKQIPYIVLRHYWWASILRPPKGKCQPSAYKKWIKDIYLRLFRNLKMLPRHLRVIRQVNPDFIYTNTSVIPMGAVVAFLLNKRHVWHIREFVDLLLKLDFGNRTFGALLDKSDAVIVNSDSLKEYISKFTGIKNKINRIYNGIALKKEFDEKFKSIKKINEFCQPYTFGMVGQILLEKKGHGDALKAIQSLKIKFPNIKLVIAGDGEIDKLESLIKQLGIESYVKLIGFINDPYDLYYSIDAILMCSRFEEFGRVTVEAMSASLPVIGSNNTGTKEIIHHEYTGLLYNNGPDDLAKAMARFIENPSWARQLGLNGWQVAKENYNNEIYSDSVFKILCMLKSKSQ